jgi:enoyl-CoA hydratase
VSGGVRVAAGQGVLRVVIDRAGKRNALSLALLEELRQAFTEHAADATLRLAVLTAAGQQSFAAGGDLQELSAIRTREGAADMATRARAALDAVRRFPVPVVAALNGVALGGGAELAVACDLRIAAAHAGIGFVQGRLNVSTAWGGGIDLMRLLGPASGLRVLARGEVLAPAEARALGLLDAVAAAGEPFDAFVERFVAPLARQAPQVMRAFKAQALAERLGWPRGTREDLEVRLFSLAWVHDDHWTAAERLPGGRRR